MSKKLVKESLNEYSSKKVYFLKYLKDDIFGLFNSEKKLIKSGNEELLLNIIRKSSNLSLLEIKSLFRQLINKESKLKLLTLNPLLIKENFDILDSSVIFKSDNLNYNGKIASVIDFEDKDNSFSVKFNDGKIMSGVSISEINFLKKTNENTINDIDRKVKNVPLYIIEMINEAYFIIENNSNYRIIEDIDLYYDQAFYGFRFETVKPLENAHLHFGEIGGYELLYDIEFESLSLVFRNNGIDFNISSIDEFLYYIEDDI